MPLWLVDWSGDVVDASTRAFDGLPQVTIRRGNLLELADAAHAARFGPRVWRRWLEGSTTSR